METGTWKLEFDKTGIKIHGADGLVAILPYPISEVGPFEAPSVKECAYLMAASPDLLNALRSLLAEVAKNGTKDTEELGLAIQRAHNAVAKATAKP